MLRSVHKNEFLILVVLMCCAQLSCSEASCPRDGYAPFSVRVPHSLTDAGDTPLGDGWELDPSDGYHGWWHLTARVNPCHSYRIEVCASTKAEAIGFANTAVASRSFSKREEFSVLGAGADAACKLGQLGVEMW